MTHCRAAAAADADVARSPSFPSSTKSGVRKPIRRTIFSPLLTLLQREFRFEVTK